MCVLAPSLHCFSFLPAFRGEGYRNGVPGVVLGNAAQRRDLRRVGTKRGGRVRVGGGGGRGRGRGRRAHPSANTAVDRRLPGLGQRERVARQYEVHVVHVRPVRHDGLAAQQAELDAQQRLVGVPVGERWVDDLQRPPFL